MRPNGPRRQRIDEREAVPWPEQTGQQRDAEALAMHFGLGYLSAEGLAKLARLLAWVRSGRSLPQAENPPDIIKPPPERVG